jgi:hypothetical protein
VQYGRSGRPEGGDAFTPCELIAKIATVRSENVPIRVLIKPSIVVSKEEFGRINRRYESYLGMRVVYFGLRCCIELYWLRFVDTDTTPVSYHFGDLDWQRDNSQDRGLGIE